MPGGRARVWVARRADGRTQADRRAGPMGEPKPMGEPDLMNEPGPKPTCGTIMEPRPDT